MQSFMKIPGTTGRWIKLPQAFKSVEILSTSPGTPEGPAQPHSTVAPAGKLLGMPQGASRPLDGMAREGRNGRWNKKRVGLGRSVGLWGHPEMTSSKFLPHLSVLVLIFTIKFAQSLSLPPWPPPPSSERHLWMVPVESEWCRRYLDRRKSCNRNENVGWDVLDWLPLSLSFSLSLALHRQICSRTRWGVKSSLLPLEG